MEKTINMIKKIFIAIVGVICSSFIFLSNIENVKAQYCSSGGTYSPQPNDIRLDLDSGNMPSGECWPLGTGVPLKKGQVNNISSLAVAGKSQGKVSAQFEARNLWDDGSIKWLWIDFLAKKDEAYYLITNSGSGPLPAPGISTSENQDSIEVDTGSIKVKWLKTGATPSEIIQNGQVAAASQGNGVYLIDQRGTKAFLQGNVSELNWKIETKNSIRTVVRVEGWYATGAGEQLARAIVRYHLYAGQPWIKIDHTFVITRETDSRKTNSTWFREIGIDFPFQQGRNAIFEKNDGGLVATEINSGQEAYVFQKKYPHFHHRESSYVIKKGSVELDSGKEAAGWSALESQDNAVMVAIKEFAPQFPKEITVTAEKITAKLWSNRDGWNLDYTPSTLVDSYWGEDWVSQLLLSRDAESLKSRGYDDVSDIRGSYFSPIGSARTHELMVGYYFGPVKRENARQLANTFDTMPLVYPDPSWTVQNDQVMWPVAAKGAAGAEFQDVEKFIETWVDEHLLPERELWTHSGWYDWGRFPVLDYQFRDSNLYAGWFRLHMTSMYGIGKNLWWAWARSGNRRYFDELQKHDRRLSETGVIHWDGGQYVKKGDLRWGTTSFPTTWSGSGAIQTYMTHRLAPLSYEYLFQDSRWILDALVLTGESHKTKFQPTKAITQCGEADVLTNLMALYRVFGEPYGTMAKNLFTAATDPNDSYGLNNDFYGTETCSSGRSHHERYQVEALVEFYEMFAAEYAAKNDDYALRVAKRAASDICLSSYDDMPVGYTETRMAMCARLYEWTKDGRALDSMFLHFNSLRDMIARLNALPVEERGVNHFIEKAVDYYGSEFGYSFPDCRFNTWKYRNYTTKNPGSLTFDASSNASVLQTLPTVLYLMPKVKQLNNGASRCPAFTLPADVNNDKNINIKDIQSCIKVIMRSDLTYENQCSALTAPDATTNIKDIQAIIRAIIGG